MIVDSGTSCIAVPYRYFMWILDRLRYDFGISYHSTNTASIYLDSCDQISLLPTIWFQFGGYWYQSDPADYVVILNSDCFLCITRTSSSGNWILGDAFLRGYYVVHNLES